jgi:hypothetical protein
MSAFSSHGDETRPVKKIAPESEYLSATCEGGELASCDLDLGPAGIDAIMRMQS